MLIRFLFLQYRSRLKVGGFWRGGGSGLYLMFSTWLQGGQGGVEESAVET